MKGSRPYPDADWAPVLPSSADLHTREGLTPKHPGPECIELMPLFVRNNWKVSSNHFPCAPSKHTLGGRIPDASDPTVWMEIEDCQGRRLDDGRVGTRTAACPMGGGLVIPGGFRFPPTGSRHGALSRQRHDRETKQTVRSAQFADSLARLVPTVQVNCGGQSEAGSSPAFWLLVTGSWLLGFVSSPLQSSPSAWSRRDRNTSNRRGWPSDRSRTRSPQLLACRSSSRTAPGGRPDGRRRGNASRHRGASHRTSHRTWRRAGS